jgi:hypothetical protein
LLIAIFFLSVFSGSETYRLEKEKQAFKVDLIELSNVKYGLFNVDEWKKILSDILSKKIEEFNLDDVNRDEMRIKISNFLTVVIDELVQRYYEQKSESLFGIIEGGIAALTGTFGKIKQDIPVFTEQILEFLNDDENREAIRAYIVAKIDEYADRIFSKTDYTQVSIILERHNKSDIDSAKSYLQERIERIQAQSKLHKYLLLGIALLASLFIVFFKEIKKHELIVLIAMTFVFLGIGVLLPMIEIDARISELNFSLLGEPVTFGNQVLYYKSKSILEVVELMIFQGRIDLLAVGVLVLLFSVIFPVFKLICSVFYLINEKLKQNRFVLFMIFKSGKWSMADVMVIAIFMAYIGFDGILSEQLKQIESISQSIELFTTNKSNLLFGFFSFLLFVILSLITSQKIQNNRQ